MARATVRFSLDAPKGQSRRTVKPRTKAAKPLVDVGFVRIGTSTYDAVNIDANTAFTALKETIDVLQNLESPVSLDNFWFYIDSPRLTAVAEAEAEEEEAQIEAEG